MSDDRIDPSSRTDGSAQEPDTQGRGANDRKQGYAQSLNEQGVWFVTAGRPHLAARCFRRACVAWPLLTVAWTNLVDTLMKLGRSEDALVAIRGAIQAGAISRRTATRYRKSVRENTSPDKIVARRHRIQQERHDDRSLRRPRKSARSAPRRSPTIYMLLRTAAYNTNYERMIPAA